VIFCDFFLFSKRLLWLLGADEVYTKAYYDLKEAQRKCDELDRLCHAVVEQARGRYTLRSTALVQENVLVYKYVSLTVSQNKLLLTNKMVTNREDFRYELYQPS